MSDKDFYYTITQPGMAEFKDRGSKFIAYSYPIATTADFKARLEEIKKEHPKATHHCFAYRLGINDDAFRVSDAGEPSGTAGKPILGQIDSKQLTNALVIVVRYFGGTLLGVPGLINAYKTSASLVLQVTPIVQKVVEEKYTAAFNYLQMNEVMMAIKQLGCAVISQETNLFCRMTIGIPRNRKEEALYRLGDIRDLELEKVDSPRVGD
ncbi:MAG: YigZ family protein [Chitinophagaceae bacterium]|nr:YigZ family protein [Chitinophagaceae bacterium]